jgi:hypothetical protein
MEESLVAPRASPSTFFPLNVPRKALPATSATHFAQAMWRRVSCGSSEAVSTRQWTV